MNNTVSESYEGIKKTIDAFYEQNSGFAGQPHDWQKLRELFIPGAILVPHGMVSGEAPFVKIDLDGYIERISRFLSQNDFFEKGIIHHIEVFGSIASVISTYEARLDPTTPAPYRRGVNYIHLMHNGSRWLLAGMVWLHESAENPLPERYGG